MRSSRGRLICEDSWQCRDCRRRFRVAFTACRQYQVYLHQPRRCCAFLHSVKRPSDSCLKIVPSAFPFPQCHPCGFSSLASARPPDLSSSPSSSFLLWPSCSSGCLSPHRTFPPLAFTRSSLSPLCVSASEPSSSSDHHPFPALTCTSLPSRLHPRSSFSQLSPRRRHYVSCHGLESRHSRGYSVCSSFSFFSCPPPRSRTLSRSQARDVPRSFSSPRSLILRSSSSFPRPLGDRSSFSLLTRSSSFARRFSTDSPLPSTSSSPARFSSSLHFSSGTSPLAAPLASSYPLGLPRVSSQVFSGHDRLGSLLYLSQRSYRRGRNAARRRKTEEPGGAFSSLSSHQADRGSSENIEETRTRDAVGRSSFTYRELPEEDNIRNLQEEEEAVDEGIDQYKPGEEKLSNCSTNASSLPQQSSGSSRTKKTNRLSPVSDSERDFSAPFPSSGIPGDAFVEFTTESVARLWGGRPPGKEKRRRGV